MTTENREELLSAYVDDELSAAERALVEAWLVESAELRKLHDDLRAMRGHVQALPRHKLDRDLAPSILRRAERVVLSGADQPTMADITPSSTLGQWWSRGRGWRRVIWPAVAIAAALLISLFDPQPRPADRQVAQNAPRGDSAIGAPGGANEAPIGPPASSLAKQGRDERDAPSAAGAAAAPAAERNEMRDAAVAADKKEANFARSAETAGKVAKDGEHEAIDATALAIVPYDFEVSPEFIREKRLEKLLDAQKIAWRRVQPKQAARELAETAELRQKATDSEGNQFEVTVSREQLGQLLAEMANQRARVSPGYRARGVEAAAEKLATAKPVAPQQATETDADAPTVILIRLRALDDASPAKKSDP